MAFLSSSFIVFLVQERSNKAKHVQLVSGVDPISYWTSAYLWDMINFMIPSCTLLILFVVFDVPAYRGTETVSLDTKRNLYLFFIWLLPRLVERSHNVIE